MALKQRRFATFPGKDGSSAGSRTDGDRMNRTAKTKFAKKVPADPASRASRRTGEIGFQELEGPKGPDRRQRLPVTELPPRAVKALEDFSLRADYPDLNHLMD